MQTHSIILKREPTANVCAWLPRKLLFAVVLLALSRSLTANVVLDMSADRVFLADGSVLECTLICKGKESLVVLVGNQERTLSTSSVLRIERGQPAGEKKFFETGLVGGHEQITGPVREDIPTITVKQQATDKTTRGGNKHLRAEKGKEGVTPLGEAAKQEKKQSRKPVDQLENKAGRTPRRLPVGIDTDKIRKLIGEAEPEDIIKVLEDLKKRFGTNSK